MTGNATATPDRADVSPVLVSIVVPARRWDSRLEQTLDSVRRQQLPAGVSVEVVVALAEGEGRHHPVEPRIVPNDSGTIPDGLNAAIAASSGEIVARVDARSDLPPDHVAEVVRTLDDPAIGCVGGAALVLDRGLVGSTYAVAFNSVLLGPTVYRYRRTSGPVDTAYLGGWRRSDLDALGGFDPRMARNQDNELAERVRASGMSVWYHADLVVGYYNDRDLRAAIEHHHEFGLWRMVQRGQGQEALTRRHVASLAVLAVTGSVGAAALVSRRTRPWVLRSLALGYVAAGASAWRSAARLRSARPDLSTPPLHPLAPVLAPGLAAVLDASWLVGLWRGRRRARRGGGEPPTDQPAPSST